MQDIINRIPKAFSRRSLLKTAVVATVPASAAITAAKPVSAAPIDVFLASASPGEKVHYHANQLADLMAVMHPELENWRAVTDHRAGFVLVVGDIKA